MEIIAEVNMDYTVSTAQNSAALLAHLRNKQLIYVPFNKGFASISFRYNKSTLSYNYVYNGFRFSNEENSEFLPHFSISNLTFSQDLTYKKTHFLFFAHLQNIFNTQYQVLAMRPAYGFNFNFGLTFKFNNSNKLT